MSTQSQATMTSMLIMVVDNKLRISYHKDQAASEDAAKKASYTDGWIIKGPEGLTEISLETVQSVLDFMHDKGKAPKVATIEEGNKAIWEMAVARGRVRSSEEETATSEVAGDDAEAGDTEETGDTEEIEPELEPEEDTIVATATEEDPDIKTTAKKPAAPKPAAKKPAPPAPKVAAKKPAAPAKPAAAGAAAKKPAPPKAAPKVVAPKAPAKKAAAPKAAAKKPAAKKAASGTKKSMEPVASPGDVRISEPWLKSLKALAKKEDEGMSHTDFVVMAEKNGANKFFGRFLKLGIMERVTRGQFRILKKHRKFLVEG